MLSEVPDGWGVKKLGDVCSPRQHPTIPKTKFTKSGFAVYGANGQIGFYNAYTHENKTIAITCRGATCGTINVVPPKSYITGNAMALDVLNEDAVTFDFLVHYLTFFGVENCITGSAQPQITRSSLLPIELAVPPVDEQRHIAEILGSVDASIKATQAVIDQAERVKDGLMEELLTGGLGGEAIERGDVPTGWVAKSLGEFARIRNGFAFKSADFDPPDGKSVNSSFVVRMSDFNGGAVTTETCRRIPNAKLSGLERFKLNAGDILVAMSGATVGKLGIVPESKVPLFLNQRIGCVDPVSCERGYLWQLMNTTFFANSVLRSATGNAQPNISAKQLEKINFVLPSIEDQRRIAEMLKSVDQFIAEQKCIIEQQAVTKKGLMDDLLTGRVRTV